MARKGWPPCPVIYEIYPRSYKDTTGSGCGDLRGVYENLDYAAALAVDGVWIAPFYPSPLDDGGYDISDHRSVDPAIGDLRIFDAIVERAHQLGLKVMIDQVLNHTSVEHPWFKKSSRRHDAYDDWYVWAPPRPDGTLPNNWMSYFGPPAWTWSHHRQQYYWHQFLSCQPNLNLRHAAVQEAHAEQMRWWRDRGVDGFRMDAISAYLHDEELRDNPVAKPQVRERVAGPDYSPYSYQDHRHDLLPGDGATYCEKVREWAGPDMYLLGEINVGNQSIEVSNAFTGPDRLDAVYTLDFVEKGFKPSTIAALVSGMQATGYLAYWLSSHDQGRHVSALGDGTSSDAKFFALACASLPGPWLIYQGEELGLRQPQLSKEETRDPLDLNFWPDGPGREGARVPIPWTSEKRHFGFSKGEPHLPMRWRPGDSVEEQKGAAVSVLSFYRRLAALRRMHSWASCDVSAVREEGGLLILELEQRGRRFIALLNFGDHTIHQTPKGSPIIASASLSGGLPARSGAIWTLPHN